LYLDAWLFAELVALGVAEVVVGVEGGVEGGDEVEEGLGGDHVTQILQALSTVTTAATPTVLSGTQVDQNLEHIKAVLSPFAGSSLLFILIGQ
jgi:hypothetical protein